MLSLALTASASMVCVLDDAAARTEARRLGLTVTGTLGVILRARLRGEVPSAAPLVREAVVAGLYLDDRVLERALREVGESWTPVR